MILKFVFLELLEQIIRTFFFDRSLDDLPLGTAGSQDDQ
jgi:hypothetical protein